MSLGNVGRMMRTLRLRARGCRQFKCTTNSNHKNDASPNLLNRQFNVTRPTLECSHQRDRRSTIDSCNYCTRFK